MPKGSAKNFFSKFIKVHAKHQRIKYRQGQEAFVLVHYAGDVRYNPEQFLKKNNDTLSQVRAACPQQNAKASDYAPSDISRRGVHSDCLVSSSIPLQDLSSAMRNSTASLVKKLFEEHEAPAASGGGGDHSPRAGGAGSPKPGGKMTVGTKFQVQLESLMSVLNAVEPQYVRCIKSNPAKKANVFEGGTCFEQLKYSGVFEAVIIRQSGYPFRLQHAVFRQRFLSLVPPLTRHTIRVAHDTETQCRILLNTVMMHQPTLAQVALGRTRVFYRFEQFKLLETLRETNLTREATLIQKAFRGYLLRTTLRHIRTSFDALIAAVFASDVAGLREAITSARKWTGKSQAATLLRHLDMTLITSGLKILEILVQREKVLVQVEAVLSSTSTVENARAIKDMLDHADTMAFVGIIGGKELHITVCEGKRVDKAR